MARTEMTVLAHGQSRAPARSSWPAPSTATRPRSRGPFITVNMAAIPKRPHRERAVRPREGLVHRRGGAPARASSSWRAAARSSSTRSARCRSSCRPSSSASCRSARSTGWAARARSRSTCASWPPPTPTWPARSRTAASAATSTTGWRWCPSACRRCASGRPTWSSSPATSSPSTASSSAGGRWRWPATPSRCCSPTAGPATCASCRTWCSAPCSSWPARASPPRTSAASSRRAPAPSAASRAWWSRCWTRRRPTAAGTRRCWRRSRPRSSRAALTRTKGNQLRAAELLGMNRNTLRERMRVLGMKPR